MQERAMVSIIVPIYKVEKYLNRCVDSILNQSYQHLEVILVNDGSPDNCGEIADAYQEKDPRVRVIHKENGGLSDARNHGMKYATGELTMFVDSDDWIKEEMIDIMVNNSYKYKADIVQSAFYYAYDDRLLMDDRHNKKSDTPICLTNKKVMYELVKNDVVKNFAWGKLYKTEIIRDIPFEKGVLFEDVFWAHQVMHQVKSFLIIQEPFYYYYQRDDSIVANYSPRNLDMIKGLRIRHSFLEDFYKELTGVSYHHILKACLIHYYLLLRNRGQDKKQVYRKEIETYIHANYRAFKEAIKEDKQLHIQLYLFSLHPYCNLLFLAIRKGLRKVKLIPSPTGLKRIDL